MIILIYFRLIIFVFFSHIPFSKNLARLSIFRFVLVRTSFVLIYLIYLDFSPVDSLYKIIE